MTAQSSPSGGHKAQRAATLTLLTALTTLIALSLVACDDEGGSSKDGGASAGEQAGVGAGGAGGTEAGAQGGGVTPNPEGYLSRFTISDMARGPAFMSVADMNGDGKLDLIVSEFGPVGGFTIEPGALSIFYQGESLEDWTQEQVTSPEEALYWPNSVEVVDVDGDGDLDLTVGAGFLICEILGRVGPSGEMLPPGPCGGLLWYEQSDAGWLRHDIVGPDSELFYHHGLLADLDGDGIEDLFTVGERRYFSGGELIDQAEAQWFKGLMGGERFETNPRSIGPGMGSLAELHDLDQDGDLDVLSAEFFAPFDVKSFAWYEQVSAPSGSGAGEWVRHVIDDRVGPAIQLSLVEDLYGDGELVAVGANHTQTTGDDPDPWESALYAYRIPSDPTQPWIEREQLSENIVSLPRDNQAAPGIFGVGDINGDSRKDILLSGDGDSRVFAILQSEDGSFETWVLDDDLPQAGSMKVIDLDGDGRDELLVTSYDRDVIYLYRAEEGGAYPLRRAERPSWADGGVGPVGGAEGGAMPQGGQEPQAGAQTGGEPGVLEGDLELRYTGDATGPLVVAAFTSWPPLGPPSAFEQLPNPSFPEAISFPNLAAGTYTILAFIDVDGSGPMAATPADVQARVEVTFPRTSPQVIDLTPEMIEGLDQVSASVTRETRTTPVLAYVPEGSQRLPMVVFTPGFQLQSSYYAPLLEPLASEGYVVVLADPPATLFDANHVEMAADVRAVIDWALSGPIADRVDPDKIATMGHSLGGKLALFNAAEDARVVASLALDPVDGDPSPIPDPMGRPTLANGVLQQVSGAVGLIGELTNAESMNIFAPACAPLANNFQTIYESLSGASWLVEWELVGADHMDFVSSCPGGAFSPCSACEEGTLDPARVIELSGRFARAFFALHLKGDSAQEASLTMSPGPEVNVRQR